MLIKKRVWVTFFIIAAIAAAIWFKLSAPQLIFINLKISQSEALNIAQNYLTEMGYDVSNYHRSAIFLSDNNIDRYLQRTIGFKELKNFVDEHNYDMFFWLVRFFKEGQKEEFKVGISSKTGEVINFKHFIEETAKRPAIDKETANGDALTFLKDKFHFNPDQYTLKTDTASAYDNRNDFAFSWQKNNVSIPWTDTPEGGVGKLLITTTVTGGEILAFSKNTFQVPEDFNRHLDKQRDFGSNIITVIKIFYFILLMAATVILVNRRNHWAAYKTKKFYLGLAICLFLLSSINEFNMLSLMLFNYSTSGSLESFLGRETINIFLSAFFISLLILMPALSGELLRFEQYPNTRQGGILRYAGGSFFTREVSKCIFMGYLVFIIMLGLQSVLFYIGQNYLNVWKEYAWMTQMSSARFPVLVGFVIGFSASIQEEILYRLFAINWFKYILSKKLSPKVATIAAVIISSAIWGFAHSHYPIYPAWFRGIEVTILGLFLSVIYLRFGLITVIIAHYLFDCFWSSAGYLLGQTHQVYVISALVILSLPFLFAVFASLINKQITELQVQWALNRHQQFNHNILLNYLKINFATADENQLSTLKKELISHGWDVAIIDVAFDSLKKKSP